MLAILNTDMHRVVEPGVYEMMVGPSSDNTKTARLTVGGGGANAAPPLPPPPAGSESGLVSNFDEGKVAANYGMWIPASDSMNGGKSKSTFKIVEPGANGTKGALEIDLAAYRVSVDDRPVDLIFALFAALLVEHTPLLAALGALGR